MDRWVVLSDVHLGSDLNHLIEPIRRSRAIDADLVRLVTHYRTSSPPGDHLRLVFAGDLVDFVGMAVHAGAAELATERSAEERAHGLGSAADHVCAKLRMVVKRHGDVFDALADLVADGHALDIVLGNHDVELHWDAVKEDLRTLLVASALGRREGRAPLDVASFRDRVAFHPWFLYVPGVVYIEHGHQYDSFCAAEHVMAPLDPADPRRITRSVSDVLLRFVVRTTRGMREYGHETNGVGHYLGFAAMLGVRGLLRLGASFASAVAELFRLRRAHLSVSASMPRAEHARRLAAHATAPGIGVERMRMLAALQAAPVTRTIHGILASVLLDRVALGLAALAALAVVAVASASHGGAGWYAAPGLVAAWMLAHRYLASTRNADPEASMLERATPLARLFPAKFVVMGHTHAPAKTVVADGASTYVNVGSWAEEEADDRHPGRKLHRAARTHLVIHLGDHGPVGELLAWGADGPRPWTHAGLSGVTASPAPPPHARPRAFVRAARGSPRRRATSAGRTRSRATPGRPR